MVYRTLGVGKAFTMKHTLRHIACWLLILILPAQALAAMMRLPEPVAAAHSAHPAGVANAFHGEAGPPVVIAVGAAITLADTQTAAADDAACPHHGGTASRAASEGAADPSDLASDCAVCALCCLMLIPASLSLASPAGPHHDPQTREPRFQSTAPQALERPPRSTRFI